MKLTEKQKKLLAISKPRSEKAIKKEEERKRKRTAKSELDRAVERYVEGDPEGAQKVISRVAFEFGAKWGIEHAINKAYDLIDATDMEDYFYLEEDGNHYFDYDKFLTLFKKAMWRNEL